MKSRRANGVNFNVNNNYSPRIIWYFDMTLYLLPAAGIWHKDPWRRDHRECKGKKEQPEISVDMRRRPAPNVIWN